MPSFEGKIPEEDLEALLKFIAGASPEESKRKEGEELLRAKGCTGCHSLDGTPRVGPSLKGLLGRSVTVMRA